MTTKETKTITVKVKHHPNDYKYPGRQCSDHLNAMMKFMTSGIKVPDTSLNAKWLKKVKVDDIVGVEYSPYKVVSIGKDNLVGINAVNKKEVTISAEDLTMAIGSGFAEILYRKEKPFGIKTTKKVKLTIIDHSKNSPKAEEIAPSEEPTPTK